VRKNVFYIHTNIVTKKWVEINARTIFPETHESASKKCWEKIVGKKSERSFLYSHKYRDQKLEGKKRAIQFYQKHTNSARKNGKKSSLGSAKTHFLYSHEHRDQKMGG